MSLISKLIVSLVIAAIAATLTNTLLASIENNQQLILLLVAFFIATAATALLTSNRSTSAQSHDEKVAGQAASDDATREHGTVKWFNVSKGFGFIIKSDGEEIFVHFRSIRGEGHRGLRDGQSVSFIVAQSDKGPQAEDVVPQN